MDRYKAEVIDPGDAISRLAHRMCVASYRNSDAVWVPPDPHGYFRSQVGFLWKPHILRMMAEARPGQDWVMKEVLQNDGAGGKPQFFTLVGTVVVMRSLGWEVITMNADDIARSGGFPAVMANEISFKRLTPENFALARAVLRGYGWALAKAHLVNITGETAVMKHSITAFSDANLPEQLVMTWGGTCLGLSHRNLVIDGSEIRPGMTVVGFGEHGYRCNGGTFFTNLILHHWGPEPDKILRTPEAVAFAQALTKPSISYTRLVTKLAGWGSNGMPASNRPARIYGIAHITGGGVWNKFGEILPPGVGAYLDAMPRPPRVLLAGQKLSQGTPFELSDHQAYGTLHGGCGMLLVCDPGDTDAIIAKAKVYGVVASVVGQTISSRKREVVIESRFLGRKRLSSLDTD